MRSDHCRRDKMLKLLEVKYIGYIEEELIHVVEQCSICS